MSANGSNVDLRLTHMFHMNKSTVAPNYGQERQYKDTDKVYTYR